MGGASRRWAPAARHAGAAPAPPARLRGRRRGRGRGAPPPWRRRGPTRRPHRPKWHLCPTPGLSRLHRAPGSCLPCGGCAPEVGATCGARHIVPPMGATPHPMWRAPKQTWNGPERDTSLSSLCAVLLICRMTIRHGAPRVVRHLPVARILPARGWRPASLVGARRLSSASSAIPSIAPLAVSLSLTHTSWFCLPEQGMTHPEYLCAGTAFLTPLPPPRPPKAAADSGNGRGRPPSAVPSPPPRP